MADAYVNYKIIEPLAWQLVQDVLEIIKIRRPEDWSYRPTMGDHYYAQEVKELDSFNEFCTKLLNIDQIEVKFGESGVEQLAYDLLNAVLASQNKHEGPFEHWWKKLCIFLERDQIIVRTIVGLGNFTAEAPRYELDANTYVVHFEDSNLRDSNHSQFFDYWDWYGLASRLSKAHAHNCTGALVIDRPVPAKKEYLRHPFLFPNELDWHETTQNLQNALRLAGFGRLITGPRIQVINPDFPYGGVLVVDKLGFFNQQAELAFTLSPVVWKRFENAFKMISAVSQQEAQDLQDHRNAQRRFLRAFSRLDRTYTMGVWESVVVDLVITLESLYLPKTRGSRFLVALAASNLLGSSDEEVREVFDNIQAAYDIRNSYVHGEPIRIGDWQKFLENIVQNAGVDNADDNQRRWYAVEIIRDYVRRSILALLNLHYEHGEYLSTLQNKLIRLHFDPRTKSEIQAKASYYPLSDRPQISPS